MRITLGSGTSVTAEAFNTFAGFPSVCQIDSWHEFRVGVMGIPDKNRGYITTLAQIDEAVRSCVYPILSRRGDSQGAADATPTDLIRRFASAISAHLNQPIHSLVWNTSPYHSYSWEATMPSRVMLTTQFEFAASHRLHDPALSDAQNIELFGKCNRLNGHGHNYRVEVSITPPGGSAFGLSRLERVVSETVINRFDHLNLNVDCPEFRQLNPTVEHIAAVCFQLLEPVLKDLRVELVRVTVFETSKTSATVEKTTR